MQYNNPLQKDSAESLSSQPHVLSFNEVKQAADRIEGGIIHTPLCEAKLSKFMDYDIYLKCENLQYTGSCAERGIRNAFLAIGDDLCKRGAIVPSSGNMAMAAAYQGGSLNVPVTVVLPNRTSPAQALRCSELGADVVLCGDTLDDATAYAKKVAESNENVQFGLATNFSVGAECSKVPKMMKALQAGRPMSVPLAPTLADGLNASIAGANAFASIKGRLDRMLVVEEAFIARAVMALLERERLVADGAGVCAIAAVMQGLVPELKGKRTVCLVSGGNIEAGRLARVIQRGLGATGRLMRFAVALPDARNGLDALAKTLSTENAVLKSLVTEQIWLHSDVHTTWANVVVETASEEQATSLKNHLRDLYPAARFAVTDLDDKHKLTMR